MHFTYEAEPNKSELMQGDVLERTEAINTLLSEVHPHYYNHTKNKYFMVLTQSCDLVRRKNICKAPYISIAPIRTLDHVVKRYIKLNNNTQVKANLPVASDKLKTKATEFLQRLFNNNEAEYFFLYAKDTSLDADCAAYLNLSIAIKADLHFDKCREAKILQLTQPFQAKLGWLVGQLYSRVGTEDWGQRKEELHSEISKALKDAAIWISDLNMNFVQTEYDKLKTNDPSHTMSEAEVKQTARKMPTKKQQILEQTVKVIMEALGSDQQTQLAKLRRRLESDEALNKLLK